MHISDQCRSPYTCYILLCPPSPTLFVAGVKRGHLVILLEAINLTLGGDSYVQMDLSGKHLFSLMDMVCNQYSQVKKHNCPAHFLDTPFNLFSMYRGHEVHIA